MRPRAHPPDKAYLLECIEFLELGSFMRSLKTLELYELIKLYTLYTLLLKFIGGIVAGVNQSFFPVVDVNANRN